MAESEDSKGRRGIEAHGSLEPICLHFSQIKRKCFCIFPRCLSVMLYVFSFLFFFFKFVCRRRISEGSEVTQQSVIWRDVFTTKLVRLIQIFTTRIFHECFSDFDYMKPTPSILRRPRFVHPHLGLGGDRYYANKLSCQGSNPAPLPEFRVVTIAQPRIPDRSSDYWPTTLLPCSEFPPNQISCHRHWEHDWSLRLGSKTISQVYGL